MMLTEKKLTIICASVAVIGILTLFAISAIAEAPTITVSDAINANSNAKVKVRGFVDSVAVNNGRAVITLASLETVEAVSFDSGSVEKLGLQRFGEVEVQGELRQYKGKNSLIISKLKQLNSSLCENGS